MSKNACGQMDQVCCKAGLLCRKMLVDRWTKFVVKQGYYVEKCLWTDGPSVL